MTAAIIFAAALTAAPAADPSAYAPPQANTAAGRIYHYLRTNLDGTEPERVAVYLKDPRHIEVYKAKALCTGAAHVTAELHETLPVATRLVGGRVGRDGEQQAFAFLTYDPATRNLHAKVGDEAERIVPVAEPVWRIYDFDLADVTATAPRLKQPRAGFSFSMALVWPEGDGWSLKDRGRAEAVFEREETHAGRAALRFRLDGPAFEGKGGNLWLDAADGHVLGAELGLPNHSEYTSFKLELQRIDDGGELAWRELLLAHYRDCPAA